MALISVIIPCYNVEKWIDRCISSIENQTFSMDKLEIICVDDCSVDGTIEKLEFFEKKYPDQFIIIKLGENGRQGKARNVGLEYATSDWIAFVDADDWIEPTYFERLYNVSNREMCDFVGCRRKRDFSRDLVYFDEVPSDDKDITYIIEADNDRKAFIVNPPWDMCVYSKLIKKEFLVNNNIMFPENLAYEDTYWISLLGLCVKRVCLCEDCLYHYFVNTESTVLKGGEHHWDYITVQTILWNEMNRRGYLDKYRSELEIDHIFTAYLQGLKTAILRYEEPNYNYYLLTRELVMQRIPHYENNEYIKSGILSELYELMMIALPNRLSKEEFLQFADNVKSVGI